MLLYIALGSALGGAARFLLSRAVQGWWGGFGFPSGTLVVNVVGAFCVGFLIRYAIDTSAVSAELRAFLTTGFFGGFTTFSAFSYETAAQLEDGNYRRAFVYVLVSVIGCLIAVYAGFAGARNLASVLRGR